MIYFKYNLSNFSVQITEEAASKKRSIANGDVAVHSEQVKLMEQEIKEQEKLLAGYQQENERIYQVKDNLFCLQYRMFQKLQSNL